MTLFSNKSIEQYFLTKNSTYNTTSKVNLVLSPEFYWVRIFDIPVENEKKATHLLPSLFEDILPSGDFDYSVSKIGNNRFLCYAFDNNVILEQIKNSGLTTSQVNCVYLAQTQMHDYESFIIDDCAFVYDKEILIKVPKTLCGNAEELSSNIEQITLDSHKINMKFYSNTINSKLIYTIIFLLGFVVFLNIFKYSEYSNEIILLESKIEKIKQINHMPKTSIQTTSIFKNMKKKVEKSKKLREFFVYIIEFKKRVKEGTIEKITYKNNKIKIVFKNSDWSQVKRYIEKKYTILTHSKKSKFLSVEVKL